MGVVEPEILEDRQESAVESFTQSEQEEKQEEEEDINWKQRALLIKKNIKVGETKLGKILDRRKK